MGDAPLELGIAEEKFREELESARRPVANLVTSYRVRLETLKKLALERGRLDDVLLVDAELKLLAAGTMPVSELEAFAGLRSARNLFAKSLRTLLAKERAKVGDLLSKFEAHLKNVEVKLTRAGRVEDAKAIRNRLKKLSGDKATLFRAAEPLIFVSAPNKSSIDRAYPDGTHAETLVTLQPAPGKKKPAPNGITTYGDHIYWTDRKTFSVHRANMDGSDPRKLVDMRERFGKKLGFTINDIAASSGKLYWIGNIQDAIYTARVDGSQAKVLISLDSALGKSDYGPRGIAIAGSQILWTDGIKDSIFTAEIDGSNARVLINLNTAFGSASYTPSGIAVSGSRFYWADTERQWVYSANLDGSDATKLINLDDAFGAAGYRPIGLVAFHSKLFWCDEATDMVYSADLDGSNPQKVFRSPSAEAVWITAAPLFQDL